MKLLLLAALLASAPAAGQQASGPNTNITSCHGLGNVGNPPEEGCAAGDWHIADVPPAAGQPIVLVPITGTNGERIYAPTGDAGLDHAIKICDSHALVAENDLSYPPGFVETCQAVMKRYAAIEAAKRKAFMADAEKQQAAQDAADLAWLNKYVGKQP